MYRFVEKFVPSAVCSFSLLDQIGDVILSFGAERCDQLIEFRGVMFVVIIHILQKDQVAVPAAGIAGLMSMMSVMFMTHTVFMLFMITHRFSSV